MTTFFFATNHQAICAQALLAAMARRHPRHTFMSAQFATNLLLREGESVSLQQVEEGMYQLQREALGVVIEDASGDIGFLWEQAPCVALARKQQADKEFMPTAHVDAVQVETLSAYQDPLPEHVLQLRDNCAVRVSMPSDLDDDEFQRVAHFVMALVDSNCTNFADLWPFKRTRKDSDDDGEFKDINTNFIDDNEDEFDDIDDNEEFDDLGDEDDQELDYIDDKEGDEDKEKKSSV